MDYIMELFEQGKEQYKDHPITAPCFNSGWSKLRKYYEKTGDTPIYAAALVLHPAYKWEYIEDNWDASWVPETRKQVEEFWKAYYAPPESVSKDKVEVSRSTLPNQFSVWRKEKQATK
jgi:hypothetical protein